MMVLVSYDVSTVDRIGRRRLRRVAKKCEDYGVRVQNSVFECCLDPAKWTVLKKYLLEIFNENEDSLRFYYMGKNWEKRVEHHGSKENINVEKDTIII